jgi:hypothetical protein
MIIALSIVMGMVYGVYMYCKQCAYNSVHTTRLLPVSNEGSPVCIGTEY